MYTFAEQDVHVQYSSSISKLLKIVKKAFYLRSKLILASASTRRARRSYATKFEQNKRIFLSILQRTGFSTEVCGYFSLSHLDCDPSRECRRQR